MYTVTQQDIDGLYIVCDPVGIRLKFELCFPDGLYAKTLTDLCLTALEVFQHDEVFWALVYLPLDWITPALQEEAAWLISKDVMIPAEYDYILNERLAIYKN